MPTKSAKRQKPTASGQKRAKTAPTASREPEAATEVVVAQDCGPVRVTEAAQLLGVSVSTVYSALRDGYGLVTGDIHRWSGVAQVSVTGVQQWLDQRRRRGRPRRED